MYSYGKEPYHADGRIGYLIAEGFAFPACGASFPFLSGKLRFPLYKRSFLVV